MLRAIGPDGLIGIPVPGHARHRFIVGPDHVIAHVQEDAVPSVQRVRACMPTYIVRSDGKVYLIKIILFRTHVTYPV